MVPMRVRTHHLSLLQRGHARVRGLASATVIGLLLVGLLAGCGQGGGGSSGGETSPSSPPITVTQTVGSAGGTVSLSDGSSATISSGALNAGTPVTVTSSAQPSEPLPDGIQALSRTVTFQIPGAAFTAAALSGSGSDTQGITIVLPASGIGPSSSLIPFFGTSEAFAQASLPASAYRVVQLTVKRGQEIFRTYSTAIQVAGRVATVLKPASVCFNVDPIQCSDSIARSAIALEATYTDIQACFPDPQLYRFNSDGSFTPVRDRGTSGRDGRVALVLVHGTQEGNLFTLGIGCKKPYESTWREFLSKYQSELQNDFQVYSFAYNSTGSIDVNGSELASRIQYISSEAPTVVLAHSMGGLVARSALVSHLADLQGIVTLATPHTGMRLSTLRELFSDFVDFAIGPSLGKMDLDPESQFLSQLRAGETEAHTRRYDVYAGAADKFVSESSALFEGVLVKNRQTFPGINHSTIRTNSQVFSAVKSALLDFLQAPPPPPPPSASRPKPFPLSYQAPRCDFTAPVGPAVQLNWKVSIDATSYEVYRNGIQMSDKFGNTSFPSTQLSFDIQIGLIAGQSYQFKVIARNAAGPTDSNTITVSIPTNICSGGGTKPELFTLSNEPPRCDFNVRVEPAVQLTWTPSIGATSYEVYRNDIRLQDQFGNTSFPSTQLSFDIQIGLIAGQSYRFKVIARNATGLTDSLPIDFTVQIPSNICPTSKTVTVANTGGIGLNLRIGPGENFSILKALPEGTQMSVVGGPTQADGLSWWNLTSPLGTGWSAVADWLTPLTPSLNSQVTVTFTGVFGLRLRQCPGLNCTILRTLQDGTVMTVIAGPVSADGYTWWGLTGPMGTGWSAVGNWLAPNPRS